MRRKVPATLFETGSNARNYADLGKSLSLVRSSHSFAIMQS